MEISNSIFLPLAIVLFFSNCKKNQATETCYNVNNFTILHTNNNLEFYYNPKSKKPIEISVCNVNHLHTRGHCSRCFGVPGDSDRNMLH